MPWTMREDGYVSAADFVKSPKLWHARVTLGDVQELVDSQMRCQKQRVEGMRHADGRLFIRAIQGHGKTTLALLDKEQVWDNYQPRHA